MAVNWDAIGDKLNKVLHNYAEFADKYYKFFTGPAQDVPVEYYDINGNKKQIAIPSVAKLRDRFISDINSAMYKEIYVDAENGSDETGDGSSSAPFKTLQKAIDSIPYGAYAIIYVQGDYTMTEDNIYVINQYIWINFIGGKLYLKPILRNCCNHKYKGVTRFQVIHSHVGLSFGENNNVGIEIIDSYPEGWDDAIDHTNGCSVFGLYYASLDITFYKSSSNNNILLKIPQDFNLFSTNGPSSWGYNEHTSKVTFGLAAYNTPPGTKVILDGKLGTITTVSSAVLELAVYLDSTLQVIDSQGNPVDIKTKVAGIIKDSNGTPRNVISNIVF